MNQQDADDSDVLDALGSLANLAGYLPDSADQLEAHLSSCAVLTKHVMPVKWQPPIVGITARLLTMTNK